MTDEQLRAARLEMRRSGEPTSVVLEALDRAVRATLSHSRLPNALSPEGHWGGDVPYDLCQRWLAEKLLGDTSTGSGLRALLEKAATGRAFDSMARRSFYHWLLSARERSQATNIYKRLLAVLEDHPDVFRVAQKASSRQHSYWQLVAEPDREPFAGSDRQLAAAALGAGEIKIVRYSASSERLDPLISSSDLVRFSEAVMKAVERAVTPMQLMSALSTRVDLGDVEAVSLDEMVRQPPAAPTAERAETRDAAIFALSQMSGRQVEVLVRLHRGQTGQDIAKALSVSPATVSGERSAAYSLLRDVSESDDEMGAVLNWMLDLLYGAIDA